MNKFVMVLFAVLTAYGIAAAPGCAQDREEAVLYVMPETLYDHGDYQEALLISEEKMQQYRGKDEAAYTVCAELAMASAARIQAYDKCIAYAAIAEQGFAKRGSEVDALMQRINSACSDIENDHALAAAMKTEYLEKLERYRLKVKATFDKHKTRRSLRNLQYKIEYVFAEMLILAQFIYH